MQSINSILELPGEVVEIIGIHLDPKSYQSLRLAWRSHLRPEQRIAPGEIKNLELRGKSDLLEVIKIEFDYINSQFWSFLESQIDKRCHSKYSKEYGRLLRIFLRQSPTWFSPATCNNLAIRWSAENGHIDLVQELLRDSRVDPSDDTSYAIKIASIHGHAEIVEALLHHPLVDPSISCNFCIRMAAHNGQFEVVKVLLADGRVDPSDVSNFALRIASWRGFGEIVELLLADPRVNPKDEETESFQLAYRYKYLEIVHLLLHY